ncbi:hypothetical protein GCM10009133_37080 [Cocleimonas flava]
MILELGTLGLLVSVESDDAPQETINRQVIKKRMRFFLLDKGITFLTFPFLLKLIIRAKRATRIIDRGT